MNDAIQCTVGPFYHKSFDLQQTLLTVLWGGLTIAFLPPAVKWMEAPASLRAYQHLVFFMLAILVGV